VIGEHGTTRRAVVAAAVAMAIGLRTAWAETATPVTIAGDGPLLSVTFDTLPAPPVFVRFARILLEPSALVPSHVHPGPEITLIERGTLTVTANGDVVVRRADGAASRETGTISASAGDAVIYPPGIGFGFQAAADGSVSMLSLVLLPAGPDRPAGAEWVNGVPAGEQLAGVRSVVLGDAVAPGWPGTPIRVSLDVVVLEDGQPLPASAWPVMYAVDRGTLELTLNQGELQLFVPGEAPRAVTESGAAVTAEAGDAVFFPGGASELVREGGGEVVLLRIGFAGPEEIPPTPEPTPVSDVIAAGTTVVTADAGARLRSIAGTSGEIVAELPEGAELSITGLPETVDGERWYPVTVLDTSGASGFIAESLIRKNP